MSNHVAISWNEAADRLDLREPVEAYAHRTLASGRGTASQIVLLLPLTPLGVNLSKHFLGIARRQQDQPETSMGSANSKFLMGQHGLSQ